MASFSKLAAIKYFRLFGNEGRKKREQKVTNTARLIRMSATICCGACKIISGKN
ncbi:MAG: hypothetical protein IPM74_04590 [Crocinitomicaceae bacterium]|nr:hypothetical protein [Crocinitomicaceae bacterium]